MSEADVWITLTHNDDGEPHGQIWINVRNGPSKLTPADARTLAKQLGTVAAIVDPPPEQLAV